MCKRILCLFLCIVMLLSFSMVSFAEDDLIPEAGDHIFFGHYEQDNDLKNGPESIEWQILDVKGDVMLLISQYILDAIPFNTNVDGNNWSTSSIRQWLNNDFIRNAFSLDEQKSICLTEVDNSSKQNNFFVNGSADSTDYLFFLSYAELQYYYSTPLQTLCEATSYSKPKIAAQHSDLQTVDVDFDNCVYSPWWLRSPGVSWRSIKFASFSNAGSAWNKKVYGDGYYDGYYCKSSIGVRPAMWVDINQYLDLLPDPEPVVTPVELTAITCGESITADTILGDTTWKLRLPEGFTADELTEADLADHYIGYYLRDDDIIAVQHSDNSASLAEWQKELIDRGFSIEGLYNLNGYEAILYRDEDADTLTASVFDGKGKLLEVTFYPYSEFSEEADQVISSIQREAGKQRLSGAASTASDASAPSTPTTTSTLSSEQRDAQYQEMQKAYRDHNYQDSYAICEQLGDYKDADQYLTRLKARLCYSLKLDDKEVQTLVNNMLIDMNFEDTTDVLVCNNKVARYYLQGVWKNHNGMYSFEVEKNGGLTTTLPVVPYAGDSTALIDGIYYRFFEGDWDHRSECYRFEPVSRNKMIVYTYQTRQSIELTKRK